MILGRRPSRQTGHWLALGIDPGQVVDGGTASARRARPDVSRVHQTGGLCVAAHRHAPYPGGVFMYPLERVRRGRGVERAVELRSALER